MSSIARSLLRRFGTAASIAALLLGGSARAAEFPDDSPYYSNPAIIELMSDVLFYVSFDSQSLKPQLASGERGLIRELPRYGAETKPGQTTATYEPGIVGTAFRADSGSGAYATEGNIRLHANGAIAFWLKPIDWSGSKNSYFFNLPGGNKMAAMRQALAKDKKDKILRHEHFSVYARKNPKDRRGAGAAWRGEKFKEGEWYLVVVNWAWPNVSMSVNGGPFDTGKPLTGFPQWKDTIPSFYLGSRGGGPTLMDEVMIFHRPLDASEAKLLHDSVRGWANAGSVPRR